MQSICRSIRGKIGHASTTRFGSVRLRPESSTTLPNSFTSVGGTTATSDLLRQWTGFSGHSFQLPTEQQSWNIQENKLQIRRDLTLYHNGTLQFGIIGGNSLARCITTVGHPEPSLGGDIFAASPDSNQPQRIKFKRLSKTAKNIMNILDKEAVEKVRSDREVPDIQPGYIIQLKVEVPENKRRVSLVKGIVIARRNAGLHTTFRLRRLVAGVGIESVYPLYSPNIREVKILDKKKVRRAKLYYLRDRMNPLKK